MKSLIPYRPCQYGRYTDDMEKRELRQRVEMSPGPSKRTLSDHVINKETINQVGNIMMEMKPVAEVRLRFEERVPVDTRKNFIKIPINKEKENNLVTNKKRGIQEFYKY